VVLCSFRHREVLVGMQPNRPNTTFPWQLRYLVFAAFFLRSAHRFFIIADSFRDQLTQLQMQVKDLQATIDDLRSEQQAIGAPGKEIHEVVLHYLGLPIADAIVR
jgi:hypothetical protein